ncbi:MAG TPA: hypothetical protein VGR45_03100, partial [Stellaceae bacterium]|nr:hypothetical protein [Stellaceae bacterium]
GAHGVLNDGDTLSHIAIGRWIIAHRAIPFDDPFSFTAHGQRWVPHEWLAEVVFAVVYDRLGWGGVVAATGLAAGAAVGLLTRALAIPLGTRRAVIGAVLAFALTEGHLLARPHALAWLLMVIWMSGIIRARDAGRAPSVVLLPVMILWCNLHGGFVVGLLFAGLLAIEAALETPAPQRLRAIGAWGGFLVLAALSALVSPNGVNLFLLPFEMLRMSFATSSISEWRGVDFTHFDPLVIWIGLLILGGYCLGLRLPLSRALMVLLLLYLALTHIRNEELLGVIAPLLVAAPLASQLGPTGSTQADEAATRGRGGVAAPLVAIAGLAVVVAVGALTTASMLNRRGLAPRPNLAPVAAVAAARQAGLTGHVFNSLRFGGYLVFLGIPTFVDGRADLFGDAFLQRYAEAIGGVGDALPDLLKRYAVQWTLLEPQTPAVSLLDLLPGWERVYADKYAVIHRRKIPAK